jgi:nucleoid DNA-binding protein|tara:strand:- start:82 stop:360 length:279 start_codon:yes stop_codon:yes gene_type:complete
MKQIKINEPELIHMIAADLGCTLKQVEEVIDRFKFYAVDISSDGLRLHLHEFGDFFIQENKGRKSNLDGTILPPMKHLKFKSSITLRRKIND